MTTAPSATSLAMRPSQAVGFAGSWWWGGGTGGRGPRRRTAIGVRACCPDQVVVCKLHVSSSPRTLPPCPDLHPKVAYGNAYLLRTVGDRQLCKVLTSLASKPPWQFVTTAKVLAHSCLKSGSLPCFWSMIMQGRQVQDCGIYISRWWSEACQCLLFYIP